MQRGQFTFYRSFWEAMKALPKKDQLPFVTAVCSYAFEGESTPLTGAAAAAFLLVQPVLNTARRRAASGQIGGSKPQAKRRQTASEGEKETEKEKENELEIETDTEIDTETDSEGEGENGLFPPAPRTRETESIPTLPQVAEAAARMGCAEIAGAFYDYYAVAGWRDSAGKPVLDWRQKLVAWRARAADSARPFPRPRSGGKQSWAALAAEMDGEA